LGRQTLTADVNTTRRDGGFDENLSGNGLHLALTRLQAGPSTTS
jgi:hypothetical protein